MLIEEVLELAVTKKASEQTADELKKRYALSKKQIKDKTKRKASVL